MRGKKSSVPSGELDFSALRDQFLSRAKEGGVYLDCFA